MTRTSQCNKILKIMLENKNVIEWTASDFQKGKWFVGYEATARMSDLYNAYPELFIKGKVDRFRTLAINWDNVDAVKFHTDRLSMIEAIEGEN